MYTFVRVAGYALVLLLGVACSSAPKKDPKAELFASACEFKRERPLAIVSYINAQGTTVYGSINQITDVSSKAIFVAIAGTQNFVKSRARPDTCWQCRNGFCAWVRCSTYDEEDASGVYGMARALSREDAESMAMQNCERNADQFAKDRNVFRFRLECSVQRTTTCF